MGNIVWTTDCHLNFIDEPKIKKYCKHILSKNPTEIVITGDISEAPFLETHLRLLESNLNGIPTYFVCGNHDYYKGSIKKTRAMLASNFNNSSNIKWLPNFDMVSLSKDVALVGHDGWYDGRYSNYFDSHLDMSDYHLIDELLGNFNNRDVQYTTIGKLAIEAATHVMSGINKAYSSGHTTVYVATHVSPFLDNCRAPNGSMSDKHWLPHFSSKIMGDAIFNTMKNYSKEHSCIVLCGHSHTFWNSTPTNNIRCITGGAEYGNPKVCDVFSY